MDHFEAQFPTTADAAARVEAREKPRLFGICMDFPTQRALAEKHCMGDCGKAIVAVVMDPEIGAIMPCRVEACPYLDSNLEPAFGEVNGEPLFLRKLKEK